MPSTIGKCKLFRIRHITLLEGETFLRNKHEIAFFEINRTFFGRKENTISISHSEFRNLKSLPRSFGVKQGNISGRLFNRLAKIISQ